MVHHIGYEDTGSKSQRIAIDAQFNAGLRRIRLALTAECQDQGVDQGVIEEMAQIF
jgi:hypothetical protein